MFPGVDVVIDASHATTEVAVLLQRFFARKSAHDLDGWMSFFSRDPITYIDAVVSAGYFTWDALRDGLRDGLSQFVPTWPSDGKSYPTRILGDAPSALVFFTDTAGLFGPSEIRAADVVNFRRHKITRQIDYWDGRHLGTANTAALAAYGSGSLPDYGESTVGETAAPAMKHLVSKLVQALRHGDGAAAAELFAPAAVFEDMTAHLHIVGPRSIGTYLTNAVSLLPYACGGTAVRHIVGLDVDRWGRITRFTALWDGSLVYDSTLISLGRTAIER